MAEETHQNMSEDNSTKLRVIVSALTLIYVLTFVGGFCRTHDTTFPITSSSLFYSQVGSV